nr:lyase family protein [Kibdelosporangium sp. MJ126-NF4]CEL13327.1 Argininosuccinate lyase [Kibdelosporangium sp. MJ126-NF4]CTQ99018.1 Argininosuccinate lyase (EC 4.3.2.1) [Kibdelosporangium sp. MJ126-NF4]
MVGRFPDWGDAGPVSIIEPPGSLMLRDENGGMPLTTGGHPPTALTGRLTDGPGDLLRDEVLDPQFRYEAEHLLPWYVAIEQVLVAEYLRMGLVTGEDAVELGSALASVTSRTVEKWRADSMSDIAFALERYVEQRLPRPVRTWHVDRSRNDLQACAQLLFGRDQLCGTASTLLEFGATAHRLAGESAGIPMPGYTHHQAAQVISPGFYFAALSDQVLHTARRWLATYDGMDACPLGAGVMAGQELPWDRGRMARLLGFRTVQALALTSVASRGWVAEVTAELGLLGTALSRFTTDLLTWGGSEHGFIDLPDELSGISSAMPQKKNFPVLERIRGRTAHLTAFHLDVVLGQRNTPYANSVEVSKEAGAHLLAAFTSCRGTLRLFTAVLAGLRLREDRMAAACERAYLGGFALANRLTLEEQLPWRRAQVISGAYIVAATQAGRTPSQVDPELLRRIAAEHGFSLSDPEKALRTAFGGGLGQFTSVGGTGPESVRAVLAAQSDEYQRLGREWTVRRASVTVGRTAVCEELGVGPPGRTGEA